MDSTSNLEITHEATQEELEYEGEEQLAVVTVVEDFAADSLRHPDPQQPVMTNIRSPQPENRGPSLPIVGKARERDILRSKSKPKTKSNKIHYETKAARKVERTKQKARKIEKAEKAGGKRKKGARR